MNNLEENTTEKNETLDEKNNDVETKVFVSKDEIIKGEDGWLSPGGKFYTCSTTEHDEVAKFLLSSKSPEYAYITQDREQRHDYQDNEPHRTKLSKCGYILVRGPVVAPDNFANLTTAQLEILKKARVLIIDPIDNSQCSPEFVIETANNFRNTAKAIFDTESYKETFESVKRVFEETGTTRENLNIKYYLSPEFADKYDELVIDRYYYNMTSQERNEILKSKGAYPSGDSFRHAAYIEDFIKSPFVGEIRIIDDKKLTEEVFEIVSSGYVEGVKLKCGRYEWWYREVPTSDPNIFITIFRTYYHHDGLSGGMMGDVNERVSARIQTKYQIENELSKRIKELISIYTEREYLPEVTREGNGNLYRL